jgi:hypothetical protein
MLIIYPFIYYYFTGSKRWRDALGPGVTSTREFQQYTHFQCIWPVSIPQRYNLTIDFVSEENGIQMLF